MARIRSIKPEFWSSEQVMECSRDARLLFIGLWNFCDDAGRHPLSPRQIKALVFPGDDTLTVADVHRMIYELSKNGLIERYQVDGKDYLQVTGWQHQKIDRPQKPKYPGPPDDHSSNVHREPSTEHREDKGKDKGKDKGEDSKIVAVNAHASAGAEEKDSDAKVSWTQDDHDLTDRALQAMGLDKHAPQSIGVAYQLKTWTAKGWLPDIIVETIKRVTAQRGSPPNSIRYFERAIADAHAELARPLPVGSVRTTGPPRRESFADIALELEQRIKSREQQPDDDHDGLTIDGTVND